MKKRYYILLVLFAIVFSVSIFQIGCDMHSGYGVDITSKQTPKTQILADNILISSASKVEKQLGEILLTIPENSIKDSYLNATRTSDSNTAFPWESTFEKISDLYNISLKQSNSSRPVIAKIASELKFNKSNNYPQNNYYIAKKSSDNSYWILLKPISTTLTSLSFFTYTFSDWILVKEKAQGEKEKTPVITSEDVVFTNGKGGNFKKDLEIKICMPYNHNNKAILKLFSRGIFPLNYSSHVESASSSYEINLLTLAQPEISSDMATYSVMIKMTDYNIDDMQKAENFIIAQAEYTDEKQICYMSQKKISFEEDPQKGDITNASIVSHSPAQEEEITPGTSISVTFSEAMNTESVEKSITFTPEISGEINYSWSSNNTILTISAPLAYFETYKMKIEDTAKSATEASLQDTFILVFNTPANTKTDTQTDTSTDTKTDTSTDTKTDTSTDTKTETGTDTKTDTSTDTNTDTKTDTGTDTKTDTDTGTQTDVDVTAPVIEATNPANYAEKISLNESVIVVFSKEMDTSSVENSISITPALNGGYSTSWSDSQTISITARNGWEPSTAYKIEIANTAKDTKNLKLKDNFVLQFKTSINPLIESFNPDNASTDNLLTQNIVINFSKSMNTTKTESAITVSPSDTLSFAWSNDSKTVTISNSENWEENTYIRTVINNTAIDMQGMALLNPQSLLFKTILMPAVVVDDSIPTMNAIAVSENTVVSVAFNKAVNHASAEAAFTLKTSNSSVSGSFQWNDNIMTFTPASKLNSNTKYVINISNTYYDSQNINPVSAVSWSFTTAAKEGSNYNNLFAQNDGEDEETFIPRKEHSMVVFNNFLWIIGGKSTTGEPLNEIFKSQDGKTWTKVTNGSFSPRFGHCCTVHNGKIWLTGGITFNDTDGVCYLNDVWNSSDGKNWTKIADVAETTNYESETRFDKRAYHNMVSYNGKLWVMLGEKSDGTLLGDIWCSTDGIVWTDRSSIDLPRKNASAVVFKDSNDSNYESIFVIGGYGSDSQGQNIPLNDLLLFKDKATNWSQKKSSLSFSARYSMAATIFNNRIWLIGGQTSSGPTNEVLASNDGLTWSLQEKNSSFAPRKSHQAVTYNNQLIISGGEGSDRTYNEVWSIK